MNLFSNDFPFSNEYFFTIVKGFIVSIFKKDFSYCEEMFWK